MSAIKKIKQGFVITSWGGWWSHLYEGSLEGTLQQWHLHWDLKSKRNQSARTLWKSILISHLSWFPFGSLGVKAICWVLISGVAFQDIFGVGRLRKVAVCILFVGRSCERSWEVTPCCSISALPITEDIFVLSWSYLASKPLSRWLPRVAQL